MPRKTFKILSIFLAIMVGFLPASGVLADTHACGDLGMDAATAEQFLAYHKAHGMDVPATEMAVVDNICTDCSSSGGCAGAGCSANTCGNVSAALFGHGPVPITDSASAIAAADPNVRLHERNSSLFRPPIV
jgi:hypothetical protein